MTDFSRRDLLSLLASLGVALPLGQTAFAAENVAADAAAGTQIRFGDPVPYSFERLVEETRQLAARPYVPEVPRFADVIERIDYDQHQRLRYRKDETLELNNGQAPIRFFYLGRYFKMPVGINVVDGGTSRQLIFDPKLFEIPADSPAKELPDDIGFAGFRILEPHSERDWIAFLGAAYFRTSGELDQFGLSARALAIDVAMPTPEEFPRFTDFYLGPSDIGGRVKIACRMNSPRITGVLEMDVKKDGPIVMEIRSRYFAREAIARVGIAPLTSMFWYSETDRPRRVDWRPEVHDSDGLALVTEGGERIWRPLNNPAQVMTSTFGTGSPKGFGLLQRDRNFVNYEDDGVFYEKRASVWIEPKGEWPKGAVQLVEIPTDDEIHDNIVCYYLSEKPVEKGDALAYDYRLTWGKDQPNRPDLGEVVATRIGRGGIPGQPRPAGVVKIVVDFDGGLVAKLDRDAKGVEPVVSTSRGTIEKIDAYSVKVDTAWRVVFDLKVEGQAPVELRLFLKDKDRALTETWSYQFLPLAPGASG
ncbi:glucan biosynthesis protein D [Aureimonas endophytica]|uniref:Glucan biosynthesis protein D n=1 Tax=Aureimonas endophytica TaxID=2027858 RepID=A0A916ZP33_9HYPH|nr:glucan biosynthesis protein [Aureimonas endophytica]GGE07220.1 glucan biosynthesis protein D [Aureimonas endophytica]